MTPRPKLHRARRALTSPSGFPFLTTTLPAVPTTLARRLTRRAMLSMKAAA